MTSVFDLSLSNSKRQDLLKSINKILIDKNFIMGKEVYELENKLSKIFKIRNAITCANGTDALTIALMSLNLPKKSIIFVPNFSYIASAEVILLNGFIPRFVDIDYDNFNICKESLITNIKSCIRNKEKISAIISVDLFGYSSDHKSIKSIANKYNLKYVIDGAQSLGSKLDQKFNNEYGDIFTTSFFPTKTLGCYGDGGAIFTNNNILAKKILSIKFHGKGIKKNDHIRIGLNSRLDTVQAGVLLFKLNTFFDDIKARQKIAKEYFLKIKNNKITLPKYTRESVFSLFTIKIKSRNKFINYLKKNHIGYGVYYDKTFDQQKVFKKYIKNNNLKNSKLVSKECVSIPCHANLKKNQILKIIDTLNNYQ